MITIYAVMKHVTVCATGAVMYNETFTNFEGTDVSTVRRQSDDCVTDMESCRY